MINVPMGTQYTQGLLVTQDGKGTAEGGTNFKFTPWPNVAGGRLGLSVAHERNAQGLSRPAQRRSSSASPRIEPPSTPPLHTAMASTSSGRPAGAGPDRRGDG